ncbi:MAG: vWA domain-containing protein [Treponema sp.]|nr:VWA domain-containing protein [Spirochaetales bacterium]MDY6189637.1 vWA domain-containing protein [Treponema sp.]
MINRYVAVYLFIVIIIFRGTFVYSQSQDKTQMQSEVEENQTIIFTPKQQELRISANDIKLIEDKENGGYHLYVKKNPKVNSILLTETTKDPLGKNDSYAYRAKEYNPINGDEIRYLDGKKLESEGAKYSLLDSTVEKTDFFGDAFHIFIPKTVVYGYEWSRHGEVELGKGTFINIRSFEKPYADYSGDYMDNPFMFDLKVFKKTVKTVRKEVKKVEKKETPQPVLEPEVLDEPEIFEEPEVQAEIILTDNYNPVASEKFSEISKEMIYSKGPETLIEDIGKILKTFVNAEKLDIVFAIDATGSMKDDIEKLREDLIPEIKRIFSKEKDVRIAVLFYRDYGDTFKYMDLPVKCFDFTRSFKTFKEQLYSIKILGREGGDIPEAVYEAMFAASEFYKWRGDAQKEIILIGDAEPHPVPRGTGKYSKGYVMALADSKNIKIHSILLPQDY